MRRKALFILGFAMRRDLSCLLIFLFVFLFCCSPISIAVSSLVESINDEQSADVSAKESLSKPPAPGTTVYQAAVNLMNGEYGDEEESRELLEASGMDYWSVRHMANALSYGYGQVAQDVIDGKYGNQAARFRALAQGGYDAKLVQQIVNGMVSG